MISRLSSSVISYPGAVQIWRLSLVESTMSKSHVISRFKFGLGMMKQSKYKSKYSSQTILLSDQEITYQSARAFHASQTLAELCPRETETMPSPFSDLSQILTPSLFHAVLKNRIPWSKKEPLDFKLVGISIVSDLPDGRKEFLKMIFPALKAMSVLGLDNVPDLMNFLPSPSSPEFPEQALGLQLLVDQGPMIFCEGVDARWAASYFSPS